MASRKRKNILSQTINRWLRQGFGQGVGVGFKPFMRVEDFPSKGTSTKLPLVTVDRTAHVFSRLELRSALFLDYAEWSLEACEQCALLPVADLMDLAKSLGIRYPVYPDTKTPVVLTVDFMVRRRLDTGRIGRLAIENKYAREFDPHKVGRRKVQRTLEKFELKRRWLELLGVPLQIKTERWISRELFLNLKSLHRSGFVGSLLRRPEHYGRFLDAFDALASPTEQLSTIIARTAGRMGCSRHLAHDLFKHLVWLHYIEVDLTQPLEKHRVLGAFSIRGTTPRRLAA